MSPALLRVVSRRRSVLSLLCIGSALWAAPLPAQGEPVDAAAVAKIRDEAFNRSQVMSLMSYLTDVHGPRLTGSPTARRAADYTMSQLKGCGHGESADCARSCRAGRDG